MRLKYWFFCAKYIRKYRESTDEIIDIFLDACGSKAKNREHFESELLSMSTRSIGYGLFHIKKSSIDKGKCWVSGCGDIQDAMNAYVVDKDCGQKCNFENKDTDTMTKLNDLFNNSILRESQIADLVRWKETYDKNI